MTPEAFQQLMRRVRAGEPDAAAELVRAYEKEIRRTIRVRLTDPDLRRTLDSMDICQSVLANFFVRARAGQFDLEQPDQLVRLLFTMVRHKIIDRARMERARAAGRHDGPERLADLADGRPTPSQVVADRDLLEQARRLLGDEERHLADQRAQGRAWDELAAELGRSPEALRKQLERALDRVATQLGLDTFAAR